MCSLSQDCFFLFQSSALHVYENWRLIHSFIQLKCTEHQLCGRHSTQLMLTQFNQCLIHQGSTQDAHTTISKLKFNLFYTLHPSQIINLKGRSNVSSNFPLFSNNSYDNRRGMLLAPLQLGVYLMPCAGRIECWFFFKVFMTSG